MSQQLEKTKGAMSVNDFAIWAGIGRTTAWKEIREGHLRAVKVSARTIIRFADAENWLATRPSFPCRTRSHPPQLSNGTSRNGKNTRRQRFESRLNQDQDPVLSG